MRLDLAGRLARPRGERGAILILSTVGIVMAMIFTALAVDIGFLASDKRTDQKLADLAALDASRDLAGVAAYCSPPPIASGPQCPAVISAVRNFEANDPSNKVSAELVRPDAAGNYVADPAGRFVRVTVTSPRKPFFPFVGDDERIVTAKAVAGGEPFAQFRIGSSLASLDTQKSALDGLIGPMLGGVSLSAVSYTGLASGGVTLKALQTKLLAMGYDVGTTDKLMAAELDVADLLTATGQALTTDGDTVAAAEINDIPIALIPNLDTVSLGDLVSVSQPGDDSALDTEVNAFDLVNGAAQVANGDSFVAVPGVNCGGLMAALASCAVSLHVIQPAQTSRLGPVGVDAKTSQIVLKVKLNLAPIGINVLSATLTFTAGNGSGVLTEIICSGTPGITVSAETNAGNVVGDIGGSGLLGLPLLGSLTVSGTLVATGAAPVTFDYPSEFVPPVGPSPAVSKHVGVASVGLAPLTPPGLTLGGTGVLGLLAGVVEPVLESITSTLDNLLVPILGPILDVLGLDLAGADVSAIQIQKPPPSCGQTRLVQ